MIRMASSDTLLDDDHHHDVASIECASPNDTFPTKSFRTPSMPFTKGDIDNPMQPQQSDFDRTSTASLSKSTSIMLLNLVAILWGTQHAVIKSVVSPSVVSTTGTSPSLTALAAPFTLVRFLLAALLTTPNTPGLMNRANSSSVQTTWRYGAEMGLYMFLGFGFQALGLEYTTAQRSGFLLYLNVKFVPFLARMVYGREISISTWISALVALTGTGLLAYGDRLDSTFMDTLHQQSAWIGDAWSVAAALASALFILRLEEASSKVTNAAQLNSACLWVVTILASIWTIIVTVQNGFATKGSFDDVAMSLPTIIHNAYDIFANHPGAFLYLSGVTTAFANWVQTKAQRDVSPERASIIYAMDPVYGAIFANWWLGEQLGGWTGYIGAGLITIAAATNALLDFSSNESSSKNHNDSLKRHDE
jgi:drug/metabolite transporter (DMT)-like permease